MSCPGKPELKQFDPEITGLQKYPITEHQVPRDLKIAKKSFHLNYTFQKYLNHNIFLSPSTLLRRALKTQSNA